MLPRRAARATGAPAKRLRPMNILLLGSGGREHALAWKMAASPLIDRLICAPGNAGIAREAECVALDIGDHAAVIAFCRDNSIDFVVVGPEAPLCAGIVDDLEAAGIKAFGPSRAAARSKAPRASPRTCAATHGIPTAAYERFRAAAPAKAYVRGRGAPIVVKADGLAAGKGVVVAAKRGRGGSGDRHDVRRRPRRGRRRSRDRGIPRRRGSIFFALCDGETAHRRSPRRRTTSASATATPVRTPAAWAPIRRRRSSTRR